MRMDRVIAEEIDRRSEDAPVQGLTGEQRQGVPETIIEVELQVSG